MATKLLMIHGRNQASDDRVAADPALLDAYVAGKKREFLAGLAKGLILSGLTPIPESATIFPFYGNTFAHQIEQLQHAGVGPPVLEIAAPGIAAESAADRQAQDLAQLQAALLNDMATRLNFDGRAELEYLDGRGSTIDAESFGPEDFLRSRWLTAALQFISRKTGIATEIIRHHLVDVAYYLGVSEVRTSVLGVVRDAVAARSRPGDELIIIGHSLGSVVAYDYLASDDEIATTRPVRLVVTAGSPLGLSVVKRHLLGATRTKKPALPAAVPARVGAWINAYDVSDVVALIHPLAPEFTATPAGQLRDERTHNPTGAHAIIDYLADPDVAAPIGRAFRNEVHAPGS